MYACCILKIIVAQRFPPALDLQIQAIRMLLQSFNKASNEFGFNHIMDTMILSVTISTAGFP